MSIRPIRYRPTDRPTDVLEIVSSNIGHGLDTVERGGPLYAAATDPDAGTGVWIIFIQVISDMVWTLSTEEDLSLSPSVSRLQPGLPVRTGPSGTSRSAAEPSANLTAWRATSSSSVPICWLPGPARGGGSDHPLVDHAFGASPNDTPTYLPYLLACPNGGSADGLTFPLGRPSTFAPPVSLTSAGKSVTTT